MTSSPTKPGPAPDGFAALREGARHVVVPSGVAASGWPAVRVKAAEFGVTFDPWQDGAGKLILAKRADGSYAASVGGVVMSIPRQVGKTFLIGAIVFALCILNPGLTVLWTAHHTRTSGETFAKMQSFAHRKKVRGHVAQILIDATTVKFTNGSRIMFGARERGFGRGFDDVDVEVFDEAQILSWNAIDDMLPAMNTAANPLPIFIGTPPKPSDASEVFESKRADALSGEDEDTAYVEFSADEDADPEDRVQWAKANPSYPFRTSETAMLRLKKNLTLDSFMREALGVWDSKVVRSVIDPRDWAARNIPPDRVPDDGVPSYGVKFSPDGETVGLAVALNPPDGPVHVEAVDHRPLAGGTDWLEDWLAQRWKGANAIVIDGKSGAGALVVALQNRGVPSRRIIRPTTDQAVSAYSLLLAAVAGAADRPGEDIALTNIADPVTASAVACAGRREIGKSGGWGFAPITDDGDVTLLEAIAMANYGATHKPKAAPRRMTVRR